MWKIKVAWLMTMMVAMAGCSVDLGSRERAPAPDYDVADMHRMHQSHDDASWCCGACELADDDVATCSDCRRDPPAACRVGQTTLVCRSNYTEQGPDNDGRVTCF